MSEIEVPEMPWSGILKVTAASAAVIGLALTGIAAAGVKEARNEQQERERVRWTDKNRWE